MYIGMQKIGLWQQQKVYLSAKIVTRSLYIGKYPPSRGGGREKYQLMSFGGKKYEQAKRKRGKI
jgi:hypothetical protein